MGLEHTKRLCDKNTTDKKKINIFTNMIQSVVASISSQYKKKCYKMQNELDQTGCTWQEIKSVGRWNTNKQKLHLMDWILTQGNRRIRVKATKNLRCNMFLIGCTMDSYYNFNRNLCFPFLFVCLLLFSFSIKHTPTWAYQRYKGLWALVQIIKRTW